MKNTYGEKYIRYVFAIFSRNFSTFFIFVILFTNICYFIYFHYLALIFPNKALIISYINIIIAFPKHQFFGFVVFSFLASVITFLYLCYLALVSPFSTVSASSLSAPILPVILIPTIPLRLFFPSRMPASS